MQKNQSTTSTAEVEQLRRELSEMRKQFTDLGLSTENPHTHKRSYMYTYSWYVSVYE